MPDDNLADPTNEVQALLAETFHVPEDQITNSTEFGDLPEWDSMGHMDMLASLEAHFGIEVNTDLITQLISVAAINEFLRQANASSPADH